jgi:hypothetical protein
VVRDERKRLYIPLTGPYDHRAEAEAMCDSAYQRYTNEVDPFADFYQHGVVSTERCVRSIYGKLSAIPSGGFRRKTRVEYG